MFLMQKEPLFVLKKASFFQREYPFSINACKKTNKYLILKILPVFHIVKFRYIRLNDQTHF